MKSLIASRRDLEFQLFEVLDAEALASRPRFAEHSRETFLSALDTAPALAALDPTCLEVKSQQL